MTEYRGLLGGICLIIGAAPLVVQYGTAPIGIAALGLVFVGILVAYGSYRADAVG